MGSSQFSCALISRTKNTNHNIIIYSTDCSKAIISLFVLIFKNNQHDKLRSMGLCPSIHITILLNRISLSIQFWSPFDMRMSHCHSLWMSLIERHAVRHQSTTQVGPYIFQARGLLTDAHTENTNISKTLSDICRCRLTAALSDAKSTGIGSLPSMKSTSEGGILIQRGL